MPPNWLYLRAHTVPMIRTVQRKARRTGRRGVSADAASELELPPCTHTKRLESRTAREKICAEYWFVWS